MDSKTYLEYLQSNTWKQKSKQRMQIDGYRCVMCGTSGSPQNPLQVHHFGYRFELGKEDVWRDLATLCGCCHKSVHRLMNRVIDDKGTCGWNNPEIPVIHAYTFSGMEREFTQSN